MNAFFPEFAKRPANAENFSPKGEKFFPGNTGGTNVTPFSIERHERDLNQWDIGDAELIAKTVWQAANRIGEVLHLSNSKCLSLADDMIDGGENFYQSNYIKALVRRLAGGGQ